MVPRGSRAARSAMPSPAGTAIVLALACAGRATKTLGHCRGGFLGVGAISRLLHRLQGAAQIPGPAASSEEVVEEVADGACRAAAEAALKPHLHLATAA